MMTADRLRVVPANSHRGLLGTSAFLGLASGTMTVVISGALPAGSFASLAVLFLGPLGMGALFVLVLPFRTQRWLPVLSAAGCFWIAQFVGVCLGLLVSSALSGTQPLSDVFAFKFLGGLLVAVAMALAIAAGFATASLAMIRFALFRTVEQSGLLCWRCGYDTASERVVNCPECGTAVDPTAFRWNWLHRVVATGQVAGWIGGAAVAASALGIVAAVWESRVAPVNRFAYQMQRFGSVVSGRVYEVGGSAFASGLATVQVRTSLDAAKGVDLLIVYVPVTRGGPSMQLQLDSAPRPVGGGWVSNPSVPKVLCDLNASHAEVVMESGIPQSLKDAMLAAAGTVSWHGWLGANTPPPNIGIDPSPHFETSGE